MNPIRVYIAAPLSIGDAGSNVHRVLQMADDLLKYGYVPFVPHLSLFWQACSPKPYHVWIHYDLDWLRVCDVVLRMPGESIGADIEVTHANQEGRPIVTSLEQLLQRFPTEPVL